MHVCSGNVFKVPTPKYWQTSLARSAKLGDTSWARLTTELTSWNFPDSQLCLESKTEPSVVRAPNYIVGGGPPHGKNIPHILS